MHDRGQVNYHFTQFIHPVVIHIARIRLSAGVQVPRVAGGLACQRVSQLATFAEPSRGRAARSRLRR
jgi:hypothetical protein